jgi:hypothetical protein
MKEFSEEVIKAFICVVGICPVRRCLPNYQMRYYYYYYSYCYSYYHRYAYSLCLILINDHIMQEVFSLLLSILQKIK